MNALKIFGILLIVAGILALVYGGFKYTRRTRSAKLGSVELSVRNQKQVNIPIWVGVALIVVGVLLLLIPF